MYERRARFWWQPHVEQEVTPLDKIPTRCLQTPKKKVGAVELRRKSKEVPSSPMTDQWLDSADEATKKRFLHLRVCFPSVVGDVIRSALSVCDGNIALAKDVSHFSCSRLDCFVLFSEGSTLCPLLMPCTMNLKGDFQYLLDCHQS